ncbi:MAG: hypothetical protein M1820_006567 [Bogoriella megaspora]|nr:MAG: hypothetical protein M1820_006567 [Bogoriella megaspora]
MGLLNFRDVGETINAHVGQTVMKTGWLYRSARPDEASIEERKRLVEYYKISSIIDLRTKTEHIEGARKRDASIYACAGLAPSNEVAHEPLKIPGITYHDINLNGSSYSLSLIRKLAWWQTVKLIGLMATGYRLEAISILGENVMRERGLNGLGTDTLDVCGREFKEIFNVLADEGNSPVIVHCTQGKDRTGIVVLLVLMLLGVDDGAIEYDYLLTGPELLPERDAKLKEIHAIGLPDAFADCSPNFVKVVSGHIRERFASIEGYFDSIGVNKDAQNRIKTNFRP